LSYDTATPYLASFVLLRDGNKLAFVMRSNTDWMNGYYGLPAGKVEKGEQFTLAALREAKEEVGVDIELKHLKHLTTVYRHSEDSDWVDVYFEATEWKGEVVNAEPEKHSELAWLDIDTLPESVIPSQSAALQLIKDGSAYGEYGWEEK
jgi:8-oxo-dGTP diphosphatase